MLNNFKMPQSLAQQKYYDNNKKICTDRIKEWRKTPEGKKSQTISRWKNRGVVHTEQYTFDELYEAYIYCGYCEECNKPFKNNLDRCLDHDHETGNFRDIVCKKCNNYRRYHFP